MAENLTLEKELKKQQELLQELKARIFMHKISVAGGVLMKEYMEKELQGNIKLPNHIIQDQADQYSNGIIQQATQNGTFEELYQNSWEKIKNTIPEHMKVL